MDRTHGLVVASDGLEVAVNGSVPEGNVPPTDPMLPLEVGSRGLLIGQFQEGDLVGEGAEPVLEQQAGKSVAQRSPPCSGKP